MIVRLQPVAVMETEWRCEAGIDVDYSGFAPVIGMCGKPAKLRGLAALCDECWEKIRAKWLREAAEKNRAALNRLVKGDGDESP